MNIEYAINQTCEAFEASDLFYGHGSDNAWDEAVFLVLHCAGLPLTSDDSVLNLELDDKQTAQVKAMTKSRIQSRKPLPYLMGKAFFAGMEFDIDERVIIPRSPMAELIANNFEPWCNMNEVTRVLDLCCGSACIGIAMAHHFPNVKVDAVDISDEALVVAKQNVEKHGLQDRVRLLKSDLFEAIKNEKYDLIISNPPYVDAEDMGDLPDEFRHEPEISLASGHDGLDATRVILAQASEHLTEEGVLIVEVGNSQVALEKVYPNLPMTWLEFEHGGDGIFLLRQSDALRSLKI